MSVLRRFGLGAEFWSNGECSKWLGGTEREIAELLSDTNGPLMAEAVKAACYHDKRCVDRVRTGAQLSGLLEHGYIGTPLDVVVDPPFVDVLRPNAELRNRMLLEECKEDPNSAELHRMTIEDAECGRMTTPVPGMIRVILSSRSLVFCFYVM